MKLIKIVAFIEVPNNITTENLADLLGDWANSNNCILGVASISEEPYEDLISSDIAYAEKCISKE